MSYSTLGKILHRKGWFVITIDIQFFQIHLIMGHCRQMNPNKTHLLRRSDYLNLKCSRSHIYWNIWRVSLTNCLTSNPISGKSSFALAHWLSPSQHRIHNVRVQNTLNLHICDPLMSSKISTCKVWKRANWYCTYKRLPVYLTWRWKESNFHGKCNSTELSEAKVIDQTNI